VNGFNVVSQRCIAIERQWLSDLLYWSILKSGLKKSKKYRYHAVKQKEQSKLKIQKTRL